jgi:excisionase family DNA binding protein
MQTKETMTLPRMARRLGVTQAWLRRAVEQGKITALRAGNRLIFNVSATERRIAELAQTGDSHDQ